MAYNTNNQPRMLLAPIGVGPRIWQYKSADTAATVRVSGYFTDGAALGMQDGDLIFVQVSGTKVWTTHTVLVTGTTVDLTDATVLTTATNSD